MASNPSQPFGPFDSGDTDPKAGLDVHLNMYDGLSSSTAVNVEGNINIPVQNAEDNQEFNTLDEPISTTIKRDLKAIGVKFKYVLFPKEKNTLLRDWDLWGPLLLCTFMAMTLHGHESANSNDGGPEFAEVFVIVWVGAVIVTLNSKLLGGNLSFFQSVCVLGYCLLPTAIALALCRVILLQKQTNFLFFLRFVITMIGFGWDTLAALVFLGDSQPTGKKALAMYPIFLFYFVISWLVLSYTGN